MVTQGLIENDLHRRLIAAICQRADADWIGDLCTCVDPILLLLRQDHDRPLADHEPSIRKIVTERCLTGAGGGMHYCRAESIDKHVALLMRELSKLVNIQLRRGEWSDAPVPPLMCG